MIREPPPESTIGSDEGGVYEVRRVWADEVVGTLYLAYPASRQLINLNRLGEHPIIWNRDLVFDGYLRKVPYSESLLELLVKQQKLSAEMNQVEKEIRNEIEKLQ